jgi:hypothetical protein
LSSRGIISLDSVHVGPNQVTTSRTGGASQERS